MARKIILTNYQSPGDIVMLTAALRDLHASCPGDFITDVRTSCPDLWKHNPWLTPLNESDPEVKVLPCHYPLIHHSNQRPFHFIHGFIQYLSEQMAVPIIPRHFKGDIHLSAEERSSFPPFPGIDQGEPYWLIAAGGKFDFTIKWWDPRRYQQVIDRFRGKIQFVQVGEGGHHHPPLGGVVDLRGKTSLRQLIHLVHHSQGVVCPVTLLMHLAAAVDTSSPQHPNRPCVVIAGGREPPHWEAYPYHQFHHTMGMLPCCSHGGCWKSRVVPLGDGDTKDLPQALCTDVVGNLPRCMDMISVEDVARSIEKYFLAGHYQFSHPRPVGA
jgi:ADP-heptose:LPS heptosyltransferase